MNAPVTYQVLFHSPGPAWKAGISFREQPGIQEHVRYMMGLLEKGTLVFGGPLLDDSGGIAVLNTGADEAKQLGENDPAVKSGLLRVTVRPWLVPLSNVALPAAKAGD